MIWYMNVFMDCGHCSIECDFETYIYIYEMSVAYFGCTFLINSIEQILIQLMPKELKKEQTSLHISRI